MSRQGLVGDSEVHDELEMLVYEAYAMCARSFAACKACPHLPRESLELVEDEASRFEVWATNTGSCRDPSLSSSLDYRLRNSPKTREMVVLLLRAVRVNLDYATRIFEEPDETLDQLGHQYGSDSRPIASKRQHPVPTASNIASDLSGDALQAVHGLVGQLKKLSTALRRATANEYNVQAAKRRDVDKDGNDLGKDDEDWAQAIVNHRFPTATDEQKHILSTAVSFRMRRFREWKRHNEKQIEREQAIAEAELLALEAERRKQEEQREEEEQEGGGKRLQESKAGNLRVLGGGLDNIYLPGHHVPASVAPSKQSFASSKFEAPTSESQSTVSVSVRSVVAGVYMDWPRPPRDASGAGQVHCPYCFDRLDYGEIRSRTKWRKHLKKDLEPYNCFYPECGMTILKMFASEAKWAEHLRVAHAPGGTWVCRMTPHKDDNTNAGLMVALSTEDDFKTHLRTEHAGMYPESRIDSMTKSAWRPHQAKVEDMFRDECPMRCPASLETAPDKAIILGVPHVANHLLSLALEALPERSVRSSESQFMDDDDTPAAKRDSISELLEGKLGGLPDPSFVDPFGEMEVLIDPEGGFSGSEIRPPTPPLTGIRTEPLEYPLVTPESSSSVPGMMPLLRGARLRYYGFLPLVEKQHRELDNISQIQDPTMEEFFRRQKGVDDLELFLLQTKQRNARRRWRLVKTVFSLALRPPSPSVDGPSCPYCKMEVRDVPENLLQHIKDQHRGGITAAASNGKLATAEWLLSHYPLVANELDGGQYTPLSLAVRGHHAKIVELLLHSGADINATSGPYIRRTTALKSALEKTSYGVPANYAIAKLLIERGASQDIEVFPPNISYPRLPPLTSVVLDWNSHKDLDLVALMARWCSDIDRKSWNGATVLHHAAELTPFDEGCVQVIEVLLSSGADRKVSMWKGTAEDIMTKRRYAELDNVYIAKAREMVS
ncbi:hypothetical protein B0T14DRAFT_608066 [Immersiella caudata]|uniref:C2H2-type domain-containing protein n=1 Tax=Immersiella caudata TaxID=314043 RepID=A0AA39TTL1_9PEZI|nr:hypothetical protein B0T14DRAFT_608066 [Immersiella caudata]